MSLYWCVYAMLVLGNSLLMTSTKIFNDKVCSGIYTSHQSEGPGTNKIVSLISRPSCAPHGRGSGTYITLEFLVVLSQQLYVICITKPDNHVICSPPN